MTSGVKFQSPFRKKVENTNMSNFKRTVTFSEQKCNYRILILKETVLLNAKKPIFNTLAYVSYFNNLGVPIEKKFAPGDH